MKKVLLVGLVFTMSLLLTNNANAQIKVGSFNEENVLALFPGIMKIDTLLQLYITDTLKGEYEYELSEFQRKDSLFKRDSATMGAAVKNIMKKEIAQHFYKIQNWQQYQQQMLQQKQEELLYPYKQKMYSALENIIKEQKYTHVLKEESTFYVQPSDNLSIKVAQRLKLPLPKDIEEDLKEEPKQAKPATGGTGTGTKPATGAKPAGR